MTGHNEPPARPGWLDVRPGEGRATALMVAHSFFTGTSTVFFETAASALFLSRYDASVLPFVYLAAAAVSILTGFAYTRVKERVAFGPLMVGTLGLLLAMVCLLRLGLGLVQASWIVLGMMVGYRLLSILTDLEYWAVAARLYDVQQSKRLFSLIGSGEVTARIGGAFSVPLFVRLMGVENLVWLSAVGLTACLALLVLLLRSFPDLTSRAAADERTATARGRDALRPIRSSSYLRVVFALALFAVLGKYFVDFAFLSQMQTRWQTVDSLASFFGLFSGITQVANLAIRVLVSGRLLNRFGIRLGLLVLPVAHLLCTVAILVVASLPAPVAVFWLVIANQGVYKIFKHPVDNPSFKILYQPLPRRDRLAAQIGVEVIVTPLAIAIAATLMLAFEATAPASPVAFASLMVVNFTAWMAAALFAYREYGGALVRALERRTLDGAAFTLEGEQSIALVREKLKSAHPGDVIFAVDLLQRIEHPKLEEQWSTLLEHESPDVRRYVLLQVEGKRPLALSEAVSRRVVEDASPKVRAAALRALAALGDPEGLVVDFLRDPDPTVERGALIGLLQSSLDAARRATERMEELRRASTERDRALLARVAGETGWGEQGLLLELLDDGREAVRREALKAVGRRGDAEALSRIVEDLSEPRYRGEASRALLDAGPRADDVLAEALVDEARPMAARARIARVAGRRRGFARADALWRAYVTGDKNLQAEALTALGAIDYRPSNGAADPLLAHVRREVEGATWELAALATLDGVEGFGPLEASLREEVEQSRERVFLLLSFLYPGTILSARDNLESASREKRAYAAEILEVTLSSELKEMTLPLLDDSSPVERLRRLRLKFPQRARDTEAAVEAILSRTDHLLRDWTKACAVYGAGGFRSTGLLKSLRVLRNARNPLIAETAHWASNRILGDRPEAGLESNARRGSGMLTIEKVILLKGVSMFAETSEEILADVATRLEEVELRPRELIFSKGDPGESMYIVVSGKVRVFDGEKTINFLGEREIFGELALLDPEPRSASVDAEEETRLFRLDRDTLFDLMTDNVGVVSGIMQVLCRRLRRITGIATGEGR